MSEIIKKIQRRLLKTNKNWLCCVCGATGSGKSYTAIQLASKIDSDFTIDNVVFNSEDFMSLLNSGRMKRGSIIIWDEAGVGMAAREWYTISNKAINYVFQTFRHMNIGVIMTTPSFDYLDSQVRKLFHSYIETKYVDIDRGEVVVKYMEVSFNPRFGKVYFKYPRINGKVIDELTISKPNKVLVDAYEIIKGEFSKDLRDDVAKDVTAIRDKEQKRRLTNDQIVDELKAWEIPDDMKDSNTKLQGYIQVKYRIGKDKAYYCAHLAGILN